MTRFLERMFNKCGLTFSCFLNAWHTTGLTPTAYSYSSQFSHHALEVYSQRYPGMWQYRHKPSYGQQNLGMTEMRKPVICKGMRKPGICNTSSSTKPSSTYRCHFYLSKLKSSKHFSKMCLSIRLLFQVLYFCSPNLGIIYQILPINGSSVAPSTGAQPLRSAGVPTAFSPYGMRPLIVADDSVPQPPQSGTGQIAKVSPTNISGAPPQISPNAPVIVQPGAPLPPPQQNPGVQTVTQQLPQSAGLPGKGNGEDREKSLGLAVRSDNGLPAGQPAGHAIGQPVLQQTQPAPGSGGAERK